MCRNLRSHKFGRQADRMTWGPDRLHDIRSDRLTVGETASWTDAETDRHNEGRTDGRTDGGTDRQTGRQKGPCLHTS